MAVICRILFLLFIQTIYIAVCSQSKPLTEQDSSTSEFLVLGARDHGSSNSQSMLVTGGLTKIVNPSANEDVVRLLKLPVLREKIARLTGADSFFNLYVLAAHKQAVSGQLLLLRVKAQETVCKIGAGNFDPCPSSGEDPYICEIAVWERPWLNSTKIVDEKTKCAVVESDGQFYVADYKLYGNAKIRQTESRIESIPLYIDTKQIAEEAFTFIEHSSQSKFSGYMAGYNILKIWHDDIQNSTRALVEVDYGFTQCLRKTTSDDGILCPPDNSRDLYTCLLYVINNPNAVLKYTVVPLLDDDDIQCIRKTEAKEDLVVAVSAPCLGCPQPISVSDPKIHDVVNFAIAEYDKTSDDEELHKVSSILKAHMQVVAGMKYYIVLEIAQTMCLKSTTGVEMDRAMCELKENGDFEVCHLQILDQPWIPHRELLDIKCYEKDRYDSSGRDEFIVPVTTNLNSQDTPYAHLNFDNVTVKAVTDYVVDYYNNVHNKNYKYEKLVKILDFSTQVCTAEVLEKEGSFQINALVCTDVDDYMLKSSWNIEEFSVEKKPFIIFPQESFNLPGGPSLRQTNDSDVLEAALFVVEKYNLQNYEDEIYVLRNVLSAISQATSVAKLFLEIELMETKCKKYQFVSDISKCLIDYDEDPVICQAEVNIMDQKELVRLFCRERDEYYRNKLTNGNPEMLKNFTSVSPSDPEMQKFAKLVADTFDLRSDEDRVFVLFSLLEAKQWIEHGIGYELKVELAETICPKYKRHINKSRCAVDIGEEHKLCTAIIKERQVDGQYMVTEMYCRESGDSSDYDDSHEIIYHNVHPSAHVRPKFLSQLTRDDSEESKESNEKYYSHDSVSKKSSEESDFSRSSEKFKFKRQIPGASVAVDTDDHHVLALAEFGVNSPAGDLLGEDVRAIRVENVLKAERQVVSGYLWKLEVQALYTKCQKNVDLVLMLCEVDATLPKLLCAMSIWERPWLNSKEVTKMSCQSV